MARDRSKNREQSEALERQLGSHVSGRDWRLPASPFTMMRRFADEMDRMFEGFPFPRGIGDFGGSMMIEQFAPRVDIFERDGKLIVHADLPGMTKEDVTVEVTDDAVVIEGERKHEHEENREGLYRSERSYGRFHRHIPLPDGVKTENASANFKNGVLEVMLDAPESAKNRRRIDINSEDTGSKPGRTAA